MNANTSTKGLQLHISHVHITTLRFLHVKEKQEQNHLKYIYQLGFYLLLIFVSFYKQYLTCVDISFIHTKSKKWGKQKELAFFSALQCNKIAIIIRLSIYCSMHIIMGIEYKLGGVSRCFTQVQHLYYTLIGDQRKS